MSDLAKLRAAYGRARGQVGRFERELAELRTEYRGAGQGRRTELTREGQRLHLVLEDARHRLRLAEQELETEERRLLQPETFLRFT